MTGYVLIFLGLAFIAWVITMVNWRWLITFFVGYFLLWLILCIIIPFGAFFLYMYLSIQYPG